MTMLDEAVHPFLDISTAHLPAAEMDTVSMAPIRVILHEYGAWVNVQLAPQEDWDERWAEDGQDWPHLRNIWKLARERGCWWINFDRDAPVVDGLPVFEW